MQNNTTASPDSKARLKAGPDRTSSQACSFPSGAAPSRTTDRKRRGPDDLIVLGKGRLPEFPGEIYHLISWNFIKFHRISYPFPPQVITR